jgi:hypothetical protein
LETFFLEIIADGVRGEMDLPDNLGEALRKEGIKPIGGPLKKVRESLEEWWGVETDP